MRTTLTEKLREAVAKDPYWWLRVVDIQETERSANGVYRVVGIRKPLHTYTWEAESDVPPEGFRFNIDEGAGLPPEFYEVVRDAVSYQRLLDELRESYRKAGFGNVDDWQFLRRV